MTLLEYAQQMLKNKSELFFEIQHADTDEGILSISTKVVDDLVISTLTTVNISVTRHFDTIELALSYWIINMQRDSGLPLWSPALRDMKHLLFDWL